MKMLKRAAYLLSALIMSVGLLNPMTTMAAPSSVEVEQITTEDLEGLLYGSRVVVREGTEYYASADEFGSGPHGTIGGIYTEMGTDVYIGGFTLLDRDGHPIEHRGYNPGDVPVGENWQTDAEDILWNQVWVELFLDSDGVSMLGWVPAQSIVVVNGILGDGESNARFANGIRVVPKQDQTKVETPPEPISSTPTPQPEVSLSQYKVDDIGDLTTEAIDNVLPDPGNAIEDRIISGQDERTVDDDSVDAFISTREIAYAIEDYAENGEKVALLLDASASVSDHMSEIADYGEYIDKVNQADIILAFARKVQAIAAEDYLTVDVKNGGTNIYAALNYLGDAAEYDRIILVTDTVHNAYFAGLDKCSEFTGKIIVVCTCDLDYVKRSVIQKIENAFATTVYLCRLDNELDRIQTMELLECH